MDGGNFVYNIISVLRLIDKNIAFKWQKIVMHQTLKYFFKLVNRFLIKNISCHILLQRVRHFNCFLCNGVNAVSVGNLSAGYSAREHIPYLCKCVHVSPKDNEQMIIKFLICFRLLIKLFSIIMYFICNRKKENYIVNSVGKLLAIHATLL